MEKWAKIEGFSHYEVSTLGKVRNSKTGRVLKENHYRGYSKVDLSEKNRRFSRRVSRLVASHFLGELKDGSVVDHINRCRSDNSVKNLRIISQKKNLENRINDVGIIYHIIDLYNQGFSPEKIIESLSYDS